MRRQIVALSVASLLASGCTGVQGPSIGASPSGAPLPRAKFNRVSPAIAYEAKRHGLLFVANTYANGTGEVDVFPQHPGNQIATITNGLYFPIGLGVDSSQNLYVANGGPSGDHGFVTEYAPPYTGAPTATYTQGLQKSAATAVAIGADGSVYVSESSAGRVIEFPPHSTKPSAELRFDDYPGVWVFGESGKPEGLALDANNDLYVAVNFDGANLAEVIKFKPGAHKGHVDVSLAQSSAGLTFDGARNLLVERQRIYNAHLRVKRRMIAPAVFVFPPGQTTSSRKIDDHFADAFALAFDHTENRLYVAGSIIVEPPGTRFKEAAPATVKERSAVYCLSYPAGKLRYTITYPPGTWILGVATTPPSPP